MWKNSWVTMRGRRAQPLLRSRMRHLRRSKMPYRQTPSRRRLVGLIRHSRRPRRRYLTLWRPMWKNQLNKGSPHKTRPPPLQLNRKRALWHRRPALQPVRAVGARRRRPVLQRKVAILRQVAEGRRPPPAPPPPPPPPLPPNKTKKNKNPPPQHTTPTFPPPPPPRGLRSYSRLR